jgi:hypothetical protein
MTTPSSLQDLLSKAPDIDQDGDPGRTLKALDVEKKQLENQSIRTDVKLKAGYGQSMFWLLVVQLAVMNIIFFCAGFGWLSFNPVELNLYVGGTLAEIFGVVLVIVRYLFK